MLGGIRISRWHPHIHAIVADGLFRGNGVFYVMPGRSLKPLAELFRARLLRLLVKEGVIDDSFVAMLMKWKHTSGFNVDNSVRITRGDKKGITALAQISKQSETSVYHPQPVLPEQAQLQPENGHGGLQIEPR